MHFTGVVSAGEDSEKSRELLGCWEKLPLPISKDQHIQSMVMEPGGTIWIMTDAGLYYWDGRGFRPPVSGGLTSGQGSISLFGGSDRGVYATQAGQREHQGKLYALSDGGVKYVADLYYEVLHERPGLYVSKSGKIYSWGNRFLAVYSGEEWKRIEAKLDLENTFVFDTGEAVYFYFDQRLYSADSDDNLSEHDIPSPMKGTPGQRATNGALWGNGRMVILRPGQKGIHAYDLKTCESVPTDSINAVLGERAMCDLFRAPDGSVWVLTYDVALGGFNYTFYRVLPQGEVAPV
jgi:hypothetical protein